MGVASALIIVVITILFPPAGVWAVAGCGMGKSNNSFASRTRINPPPFSFPHLLTRGPRADGTDLFINICLTLLGYIPGHLHAFYLEYIYFDRREQAHEGRYPARPAPGVYSDNVQTGGQGYGTIVHQT
ncbi:hypothetical protein MY4824_002108 [Beauveria thailandica]